MDAWDRRSTFCTATPKGHKHEILLLTGASPERQPLRKGGLRSECRRCHGPDGKGEDRADKFFGTKIPRLTSAEIQGKPDTELKEIITKGSSIMPPVEIDEAGFGIVCRPIRNAVVAQVRTLKQ